VTPLWAADGNAVAVPSQYTTVWTAETRRRTGGTTEDYFGEAALMDLDDLRHITRDGVHIASLAGAWVAAVAGFGGMRDHDGNLTFAPRLERLTSASSSAADDSRSSSTGTRRPTLLEGPLLITHHGDRVEIPADAALTKPIPAAAVRAAPTQPTGRKPARRKS
jgi:alpha,alpha-trehalose phosphorylase